MNYRYRKVMFFNIFLSLLIGSGLTEALGAKYEVGTNTVTRDIYFKLEVQDSLLVIPESVHLDFGDILKGSTDTKHAETKIKVEAGTAVKSVKASYEDAGTLQKDGSRKIEIKYVEENKPEKQTVTKILRVENTTEKDTIDVYMMPFENSYDLEMVGNKNQVEVPVKGEIRGVGDAKLGKYEGKTRVKIEVTTKNVKEGEIR